jgi:hypothetical protein
MQIWWMGFRRRDTVVLVRRFVSGHGFSRAENALKKSGFSPCCAVAGPPFWHMSFRGFSLQSFFRKISCTILHRMV